MRTDPELCHVPDVALSGGRLSCTGKATVKLVPSLVLVTLTAPPYSSTSCLTKDRPIPVPGWMVVSDSSTW